MRRIVVVALSGLVLAGLTAPPTAAVAGPSPQAAKSRQVCVPKPQADCAGKDLTGLNLKGRNLKGIDLRGARLRKVNLKGANLKGARLQHADIHRGDLRKTRLVRANLKKTRLTRSDLRKADLRHANLKGARLDRAQLHGARFGRARLGDDGLTTHALPDDGAQIMSAIDAANKTVDIVIYEIGGPNIVGQAGAPGALMRAVSRGVDVRIMVNPAFTTSNCTASSPQGGSACAGSKSLNFVYATLASLKAAAAASSNPGSYTVNFANNNFNVTHQKTILIDATDPGTGQPLPVSALPSGSRALVSTGNLNSYGWGSSSLTAPASGCYQGCADEWAARDFFVSVTEPDLINTIASVFVSDLFCGATPPGTTPSVTNTNGLLNDPGPLTWSNGYTTPVSGVPTYPGPLGYSFTPPTGQVVQGNARQRTLALINSAQDSLLVYNEELNDTQILAALAAKTKQLTAAQPGSVKVVMTISDNWFPAFHQLAKAGAIIRLTQADDSQDYTQQIYVHAKVIVADSTDAFLGSENISYASLNFNRELGLMLTTRTGAGPGWLNSIQGVSMLINTFMSDFMTPDLLQWDLTTGKSTMRAQVKAARSLGSSGAEGYPMLCGPAPARTS